MLTKLKENKKGNTVMEAVIALAIFSILVISVTGIFKMTVEAQRNTLAAKNIQESLRYALEAMSKEIRSAQKNSGPGDICGVGANEIYRAQGGNPRLRFKNADGECVDYQLNSGQIRVTRGSIGSLPITPASININSMDYIEEDIAADQQARLTIRIVAEANTILPMHKNRFVVQTTISSRYYE